MEVDVTMRNHEIVIGIDDSPSSRAALLWGAKQARLTGAVIRAIHAIHVLAAPVDVSSAGRAEMIFVSEASVEESTRIRVTNTFEAIRPEPDWLLQFAEGDAGRVLVRHSQQAELLVVGTREHTGLGRILVGSVSHYCLSHAACPVVAVPSYYTMPTPQEYAVAAERRNKA